MSLRVVAPAPVGHASGKGAPRAGTAAHAQQTLCAAADPAEPPRAIGGGGARMGYDRRRTELFFVNEGPALAIHPRSHDKVLACCRAPWRPRERQANAATVGAANGMQKKEEASLRFYVKVSALLQGANSSPVHWAHDFDFGR